MRLDFYICLTKYTGRMETEEHPTFDTWLPRQAYNALGKTQVRSLRHSTALSKALVLPSHGKKMNHEIGDFHLPEVLGPRDMLFHFSVSEYKQIRGAVAFHRQACVPCVRATGHHLTSDMLVFMCQSPEAEGRGQDNFLTRNCVGVLCPCPGMERGTLMSLT